MQRGIKVIFAGGGTGGHLFPGVAIAEELKRQRPDSEALFVINRGWSGPTPVTCHDFAFRRITAPKWRGKSPWRILLTGPRLAVGFFQSVSIIASFRPHVIVGLGGYVSCPLVFAGIVCRRITIIQEQNYKPGLTNRLLSRFVDEVEVGFPETKTFLRSRSVCVTGNPVRRNILTADRLHAIKSLGLRERKLNLVIFGGSHGARRINLAVLETVKEIERSSTLLTSWQIIHIAGRKDYSGTLKGYESCGIKAQVFPFVEHMENIYAVADLLVCRAGGGTIAELTALGLPAIYIPYPWASDNHQEYNARWVCERGAGILIVDNELETRLRDVLVDLMEDVQKREKMASASGKLGRPQASADVVERILTKCSRARP